MKQTKFALLAAVTLTSATLINVAGVQAVTVSDKVATKATLLIALIIMMAMHKLLHQQTVRKVILIRMLIRYK